MLYGNQILVLDDNRSSRTELQMLLEFIGEQSRDESFSDWLAGECRNGEDSDPALVFVPGKAQSDRVFEALERVRDLYGATPVVLIDSDLDEAQSRHSRLQRMVVANLKTPLNYHALTNAIHNAQRYTESVKSAQSQQQMRPTHLFRSLVGSSPLVTRVREMMAQVAASDVTVLIEGESGTGKEVVARNIHYHSNRSAGPFVPVNCGAIPAELLESELFGHEKGAFTGALSARAGRFELAQNGTLFLDEIGDMPLPMQVKILRVLQEKTFERVGGNKTYTTNTRIIAATHRNLAQMIEEEKFREDLYYRLNVFPIEMPALRSRSEDVPLLIGELIARMEGEKRGSVRFSPEAIHSLCGYHWPGNVRELANLVERMAVMRPGGVVGMEDLPEKYCHDKLQQKEGPATGNALAQDIRVGNANMALLPRSDIDLKQYITQVEQSLIQQALDSSDGVVAQAAKRLMIRRTTLVEKIKKYGLQRDQGRCAVQ